MKEIISFPLVQYSSVLKFIVVSLTPKSETAQSILEPLMCITPESVYFHQEAAHCI